MEHNVGIHFIIKDFELQEEHFLKNRKLAELYVLIYDEINQIKEGTFPFNNLGTSTISVLLIEKLKILSFIQEYFLERTLQFSQNRIININGDPLNRKTVTETKYIKLKGLKIISRLDRKNLAASLEIKEIDQDLWEYEEEIDYDYDQEEEEIFTFKRKHKDSEPIDSIDWEETVMRALQNGHGEKFGY